jgi:PAS domain S-box-containing protein
MDRERILVIDDDESTRKSLSLIFQAKGYDVETAATGRAAAEKASERPFNLALIDIRLPDMEGMDLLAPLKETNPDIVLILVTGYVSLDSVVQAMNQGASAYITKPLDMDEVLTTVNQALEKQRLIVENRALYEAAQRELVERKRAEGELAQERYLLRTLLENIPDHIYFKDTESRFLRVNRAMANWFGVGSPSKLLGKTDFDFFTDEHACAAFADEQRLMETRQPLVGIEEKETWPDGRETWVSTTKMPLYDREGQIIGTFGVSRDIRERKRVEEELRRSRDSLDTAQRIAHLGNWDYDIGTGKLYWSDQVYLIFGLDPEQFEATYETFLGTVHPSDRELVERSVDRALREHTPYRIEHRIVLPNGTERIVHEQAEVILNEDGEAVQMVGTVRDITERVQAERELAQRATQLSLLNEIGAQIAAELEVESVLSRAVSLVQERFGYHHVAVFAKSEQGELVMRARAGSYADLFPAEHRLKLGKGIVGWVGACGERLLSNDTRTTSQYVNLYPDAMQSLSELSVPIRVGQEVVGVLDVQSPQLDAFDEGDVIVMETLADQIAIAIRNSRLYAQAQQRANELAFLNSASQVMVSSLDLERVMETTMRQATEVLQMEAGSMLLVDSDTGELVFEAAWGGGAEGLPGQRLPARQGIAGWVAEHGQSAMVHDVRQDHRFYSLFDERSSDFTTRSILCVPLIYREQVIGVMQALNKLEGEFTTEDQRLLEALASTAATAIENARLYKAVQRELEERMRAEEALRKERASLARRVAERTAELSAANAELARAARLKDEFLASMSHELRTPLNAVLGLSEALQEQVYGSLTEGQARSLQRIEESGRHLLELINDILDISKIEAGKLELEVHPTSVDSVCEASLRLIRQMAQEKRLRVVTAFDSQVNTIQADERRLKQILVNLLTNACKFTPEGGKIGLEVVGDKEAEIVRFVVWDTGIGISQQDMERLFQPFVQLDSRLSRRYEGTGLGLAMVMRLTELHGGGVSVESDGVPGQGSRFTVSLPWQERQPRITHTTSGEAAPTAPEAEATSDLFSDNQAVVLLAEDNEDNISTTQDYLRSKNYRVIVARNGIEAIARTKEERPDIVLMDIQMPEMDGLEAIRRIRADETQGTESIPIIALTALAMPGDRERCLAAGADVYLSKPVSLSHLVRAIHSHLKQREEA